MFNSTAAIYGLKYQARCITALPAQEDRLVFLIGTSTAREDNEVHLIEYFEESNSIVANGVFKHKNEIWSLASCPTDEKFVFSIYNTGQFFGAALWRFPRAEEKSRPEEVLSLHHILDLKGHKGFVPNVWWNPAEDSPKVVSLDEDTVRLWQIDQGMSTLQDDKSSASNAVPLDGDVGYTAGSWDPHHTHQFVAAHHRSLLGWDLRTMKSSITVKDAHTDTIRDVDYNPNRPYHIATASQDRCIKFWDLRKVDQPLRTLSKHTHWVTSVKYNRFHDQLVLSSGTDSVLNLWNIVSISSAPLGELEDPANQKEGDKLIKIYDEHEESVYSVTWSTSDPWIFASLSYDGRVVVNHVPPAEKYKILL